MTDRESTLEQMVKNQAVMIAGMREALKPFAAVAAGHAPDFPDDYRPPYSVGLTMGDFRCAERAGRPSVPIPASAEVKHAELLATLNYIVTLNDIVRGGPYDCLMAIKAAANAIAELTAAPAPDQRGQYAEMEIGATIKALLAEAVEHRKNIIECRIIDPNCNNPKFVAEYERELARFDALIERGRKAAAAISTLERERDGWKASYATAERYLGEAQQELAVALRERDAMREALEEVERRKPGVFPFIAAALTARVTEPKSEGLCETTLTERFANPDCKCGTYEGNKGPCKTFVPSADPERCVYCDHKIDCHVRVPDGSEGGPQQEPTVKRIERRPFQFRDDDGSEGGDAK